MGAGCLRGHVLDTVCEALRWTVTVCVCFLYSCVPLLCLVQPCVLQHNLQSFDLCVVTLSG